MKKIKFLLVAVAALMSGVTMAQKVTCADVAIEDGAAELEFMIDSDQESTLCEFFLTMPTGIAIEQEDGDYIWENGSMLQRTHSVSIIDRPSAGDIYVLIKNESGKNFKTPSGQLLIVPIVAGNIINGTYQIGVDGVNITNLAAEQINTETSFTINVTVGPTGIDEVNGAGVQTDGKYLKDGQVIIKKGDKEFTAVGTSKK